MRSKVKLLSHDVTIVTEDPSSWGISAMGMASTHDMTVRISSSMPHDAKCSTTLHELVHIIDGLLQLGLSEQQTDGVAMGIHTLLKDNKKFIGGMYG